MRLALALLVKPMVRLTHLALPEMRKSNWGRIVFVTSSAVREPIPMLVLSNSIRMAVHLCAEGLVGPLTEKQADLLFTAREDCERRCWQSGGRRGWATR